MGSSREEIFFETKRDRLSELHPDILNMILLKLPLKEAIRTSILSKQWRCKWCCLPDFELESYRAKPIVFQYLHFHQDAIFKFKISNFAPQVQDLHTWIHVLSTKGVKELILENDSSCFIDMPVSLFSLKKLHYLELEGFNIKVQRAFQGFNFLTSLILMRVSIHFEDLETLIRECSALETLGLIEIDGMLERRLMISAPNLKYMKLGTHIQKLRFEGTKSLARVDYSHKCNGQDMGLNLFKALSGVSSLESLSIDGNNAFFKSFISGNVNEILPLNHLSVFIFDAYFCLDDEEKVRCFLAILARLPHLKSLRFSINRHGNRSVDFFEVLEPLNLNRLEAVGVNCRDYYYHLEDFPPRILAKFLQDLIIGNSPRLKTLEITKCILTYGEINLTHESLDKVFHRVKEVSPQVNIILKAISTC